MRLACCQRHGQLTPPRAGRGVGDLEAALGSGETSEGGSEGEVDQRRHGDWQRVRKVRRQDDKDNAQRAWAVERLEKVGGKKSKQKEFPGSLNARLATAPDGPALCFGNTRQLESHVFTPVLSSPLSQFSAFLKEIAAAMSFAVLVVKSLAWLNPRYRAMMMWHELGVS